MEDNCDTRIIATPELEELFLDLDTDAREPLLRCLKPMTQAALFGLLDAEGKEDLVREMHREGVSGDELDGGFLELHAYSSERAKEAREALAEFEELVLNWKDV
jgi:hypothetical protein